MRLSLRQSQSTTGVKKAWGRAQLSSRPQFLLAQHQEAHSLSLHCSGSLVSGFSSTCKDLASEANGTHKSATRERRSNLPPRSKYIQIQNDAEDCASWPTPPDGERGPNRELLKSRRRVVQNVGMLDVASNWFGCVFSKSLCIRSLTLQIVMKRQFRGEASWKVTMASRCCCQDGLGVVLLEPGLVLKRVDYSK